MLQRSITPFIFLLISWQTTVFAQISFLPPEFTFNPARAGINGFADMSLQIIQEDFTLLTDSLHLHLQGYPGEVCSFQIAGRPDELRRVQLNSKNGIVFSGWRVGTVPHSGIEQRLFPDILIPLLPDGSLPMLPQFRTLFPDSHPASAVWIDLLLPADIRNSTVRETLLIYGDADTAAIALQIHFAPEALPEAVITLDMNDYGDKYLNPFKKTGATAEALLVAEQEAFVLAAQHHAVLKPLPYKSQRGIPQEGMAPILLNDDLLNPQLDWSGYDRRFGPLLSGKALPKGKPLAHFYLPFNPDWPAPFSLYETDRATYEQIWQVFARAFISHFNRKGWNETTLQIYCNQKPGDNNTIPWNLDEPKSLQDCKGLNYYALLTQRSFGEPQDIPIGFRLDIAHYYCDEHRGDRNKDLNLSGGAPFLEPADIWVISRHSIYDSSAVPHVAELVSSGREVWIYGDTPVLEEAGSRAMARIYEARLAGLKGFVFWKSLARSLEGNSGFDHIFYALDLDGKPAYYPTVRLKQLRCAIDDLRVMEYRGWSEASLAAVRNVYQQGRLEEIFQQARNLRFSK